MKRLIDIIFRLGREKKPVALEGLCSNANGEMDVYCRIEHIR